MAYGIMRVEKRVRSAVYGLQIEANRIRDDHDLHGRDFDRSDIDWMMTDNNVHLVCNMDGWNKEITRQIKDAGCRERKDSIVLLDGLYTASPEWFAEHSQDEWMSYFKDCLAYHVQEYCQSNPERIINAVIHVDESTPHMQVASVPIYEGEKGYHLSAKIIMGNRTDYQRRQTRFWEQVSRSRGLERGETDIDRKRHELTQQYKIAKREQELAEIQERTAKEQAKMAAIIAERQRIDRLEHELQQARVLLQLEQEKTANIEAQLKQAQEQQREVQDVLDYYPGKWDEMVSRTRKAREMERAYQHRFADSHNAAYVPYNGQDVPIRQFLRQYLDECNRQHIHCKPELSQRFSSLNN